MNEEEQKLKIRILNINPYKIIAMKKTMRKTMILVALALLLPTVTNVVRAQRPVGDTIIGMEPTYLYYIYDWWRCANHDPEAPQWYTLSGIADLLFRLAYWDNASVRECYSGPNEQASQFAWLNYSAGNDIRGVQMVTDRPIKIVGVAACAYAQEPSDTTLSWYLYELESRVPSLHLFPNMRDTTLAGRFADSLMLLKPTNNGPTFMAGGPWRVTDAHRYLPLPMWIDLPMGDTITYAPDLVVRPHIVYDSSPVMALYEVMLDKPQVVTDSFIVAGTAYNNEGSYATQFAPGNDNLSQRMWLWDKRPTRYWDIHYWYSPDMIGIQTDLGVTTGQNVLWYKYRSLPWIRQSPWDRDDVSVWFTDLAVANWLYAPVIFPIIDPEFDTVLCDEVRDLRVAEATDTTLTLMWNGGNNVQWEVQYMEVNGWDVLTERTAVPMVTLTGLRERTNYMVRVRGMCEWDTEYGPWSEWADVYTGAHHDDPPESISNLGRFTQMMPNPASGQVTVLSSYRLSHVVVYDLAGHAVLEVADDGLTTTFDVSGLSKGVYVVAIHTPAGIATKRLVKN